MAVASRTEISVPVSSAPVRLRVDRAAAWFVPNVALIAAVVAVIQLASEFGGATKLFNDADAGWHIRTGERILSTGALPHTDPFSFSRPGREWFAWEWSVDVISGALHRAFGLAGVAWFYALTIGASVWMWFRLCWKAGGNFLLVCVFATLMLSTANMHWLARPHLVSWLFLLATVWYCERRSVARRDFVLAFLFTAAWANVHGSFFLAALIPLVYAAGAWLSGLIWDAESEPRPFLYIALAAAAGALLNPFGWRLYQHVFAYLTDSALLDHIGEYQSFNFHAAGATQIILTLLIGITGGVASMAARRADRALLALILTAGALRSARMLPIAALILLPLAAGSITSVLRSARVGKRFGTLLDDFLAYGDGLRALDSRFHGAALVPWLAVALFGVLSVSQPGFPATQFPVAASAEVAKLPESARLFSSDKFGGYLIYRFAGARKVFFDGRSDFYGAELLSQYTQLIQVRPGWRARFDAWNFTHALVSSESPLSDALRSAGWRELYRDKVAVLLERVIPGGGAS